MKISKCDICLNEIRKVKYISSRGSICQYCVTYIIQNYSPLSAIIENRQSKIRKKCQNVLLTGELSKSNEPKPPIMAEKQSIIQKCERLVIDSESFGSWLYRSIVSDSKRKEDIQRICSEEMKKEKVKYQADYNNYLLEYETFVDRRTTYENNLELNVEGKLNELLRDTVNKKGIIEENEAKLYRAYYYGYVNKNGALSNRLDEALMSDVRNKILYQDNYKCIICGKGGSNIELHIHHIIPLSKFGTNNYINLVPLCYSCHNEQHKGIKVTRHKQIHRKRHGGEFIAVDIETTGLSNKDAIIEIAAVKFKAGKPVEHRSSLVNPNIQISKQIENITGITNQMVSTAPLIKEVLPAFLKYIEGYKLIFHNAPFDIRFITKHAENIGLVFDNEFEDTLKLTRKKYPELNNHRLQTLVNYFNIPVENTHRALYDSYATGYVYIRCLQKK